MRQEMDEQRQYDSDIIKVNQTAAGFAGSGNSSAYRVDFTTNFATLDVQSRTIGIFMVDKGIGYEVHAEAPNVDYARYEPIFQKMIDSFRVTHP
jgi:hypothetical protein